MNTAAAMGIRPPFTPSQWQELEDQALIFKYMMAGMPVPPDLLLPIKRSLESPRFFHHPTSYCSFYGKKTDPEPGRCRRTDGKKWRCSKDAYPDSKYCERHMHRGRNRSRKPVETHTISQTSSTVTSLSASSGGAGTASSNFQNLPHQSSVANPQGSNASQFVVEPPSFGSGSKDYRYLHGMKGEVDEHSFFSEASGSLRGIGMDNNLESSWRLAPTRVSSFPLSKDRNGSIWPGNYPQVQGMHDVGSVTVDSVPKQQQHCFFGSEFTSAETVKQEGQPLRPFFDEWPKSRDSWTDLEDERSNKTSVSTTQLSISIPLASPDFLATTSRSPNDD